MEAQRFPFSARGMIPRWFLVVWDCLVLLIVGVAIADLRLDPLLVVFLAYGVAFIVATRIILWIYSNPNWNCVELRADSLRMLYGHPMMWPFQWIETSYSNIETIRENSTHSFWPFWIWPYKPVPPHVDLVLRTPAKIGGLWFWRTSFSFIRLLHLDVTDAQRFVEKLKAAGVAAQSAGG